MQVPQISSQSPRSPYEQETLLWQRKGFLGWWFALTAPPRPADMSSFRTREYTRRGEMTSLTILAVFLFLMGIISNSLSDPSTAESAVVLVIALVIAAIFNRYGRVSVAAYITLIFMMTAIMLSIVQAKGGLRLIWFTTYDLFCIPVFFSSLIIHRRASPIFALIAAAFIIGDYTVHPHALLNSPLGAHNFDEMAYEVSQPFFNWWALINRNVLLIIFTGFFGWAAAFSFEKALMWAEQARGEAIVANAIANYKEATAQELSQFLNELVEVFVAQANGTVRLLRERPVNDPFHQASLLLNERLRRFEAMRKQQSIWGTGQVAQGVLRLSNLLAAVTRGQVPIQMLARFKTEIEVVDFLAQQVYAMLKPRETSFSNAPDTRPSIHKPLRPGSPGSPLPPPSARN